LRADGHQVEVANYRLPSRPAEPIRADYLLHLAASGGGSHHVKRPGNDDPTCIRAVNVEGMETLLGALTDDACRVIFLSSLRVYGHASPPLLADENSPPRPFDDYARAKVDAEAILRKSGVDYMILRASSVFGPAPDGRFGGSFLNLVVDGLLRDGIVNVHGGDQGIDTLYLADLVELFSRICHGEWHPRQTFNVAGEVVSVTTMMDRLAEAATAAGLPCFRRQRPWVSRPDVLLDNGKLKQAFPGWLPTELSLSLGALLTTRRATNSG
jgi:nucleoside-diphosphate-sugar epimerase